MGKKTKSKKKRSSGGGGGNKKSTERTRSASVGDQHHQEQPGTNPYNFVSSAGPGCYIAHLPPTLATEDEAAAATASNDWLLDIEPFHPDDFDDDVEIPEIALDPYEHTVSVTNATSARRVCYVTVYDVTVLGRDGRALPPGISIDNDGNEKECTTFIVLCPPTTFVHLGQLATRQRAEPGGRRARQRRPRLSGASQPGRYAYPADWLSFIVQGCG